MLERKRMEDGGDPEPAQNELPAQVYSALLHIREGPSAQQRDSAEGMTGWSSHYPANYGMQQQYPGRHMMPPQPTQGLYASGPISAPPMGRSNSSDMTRRPSWQQSSPGAIKGLPLIQQARRGSLPYPAPIQTNVPNGLQPQQLGGAQTRTVSAVERPARSQIPLHVAISMGGRRSSLPANSRSISLGSFTPPRIGSNAQAPTSSQVYRRGLSPIVDQDQYQFDTFDPQQYQQQGQMQNMGMQPSALPSALSSASPMQNRMPGPLPNPSFSFGVNNTAPQPSFQDTMDTSGLPMVSPADYNPPVPQYGGHRNYSIVSLASAASGMSGTTATDSERWPLDSEWERQPFGNNNASFSNDPAMVVQPDDGSHLVLPTGFDPDRRASA